LGGPLKNLGEKRRGEGGERGKAVTIGVFCVVGGKKRGAKGKGKRDASEEKSKGWPEPFHDTTSTSQWE